MPTTCDALPVGFLVSTLLMSAPSSAADLDAQSIRRLVSGTTWSARVLDTQAASWDWKSDGTVCLRLGGTSDKCDDSGTWKLDGERVCYQMTWWLKSYGLTSACLSVAELGNGRYEAKTVNGSRFMQFTIVR